MRALLPALILSLFASAVRAEDYGAPMPEGLVAVPLAAAVADPARYAEGRYLFTGRIGEVCQKKGCWIMLTDGDAAARVMTAHKFFLPKDAAGEAAVVGTLTEKVLDAEAAAHFTADAGPGGRALAADDREWRITASTIRVESGS